MKENITQSWFNWFYGKWERYSPGDLLENGINPSKIAEGFVNDNEYELLEFSKNFDHDNEEALNQFMKLTESELHVLKYFLKLIRLKKSK